MALIYEPIYFVPQEVISLKIFEICGPDALYMYHPDILQGADKCRLMFGAMIANTYHSPRLIRKYGYHRFRGLRAKLQKIGAKKSAHKIGINKPDKIPLPGVVPYSSVDLDPVNVTPQEMHEAMKSDEKYWSQFFTRVETHKPNGKPITWFHGDNKPWGGEGIKFFRP